MKDITIYENFINDEELEEARQFIGDESLNLDNKHYGSGHPSLNRQWVFISIDNAYKKVLVDLRPTRDWAFDMENIIPSAKKFILKMKNRIDKYTNINLDLERVYLNRQVIGQDVVLHTDDTRPNFYTLLIYIGDITPENYDKTGGDLEFKNKENTRIEPFTKRAVLFKGYIPHQAYAPLVPGITRISFAIKFVDTPNKLPFVVKYMDYDKHLLSRLMQTSLNGLAGVSGADLDPSPESLCKSAVVRRAESEKLAAEAETHTRRRSRQCMKDITIFENFINDEELEEARQFIGDESLNLDNKDLGHPSLNRQWHFLEEDNAYKKHLIDLTPKVFGSANSAPGYSIENLIPSAKKFILKMKNRIDKYTNINLDLERVYLNRQVIGQDVVLHTDDTRPNFYTLLIYIGDITPENYDKTGGDLEFKNKENTRIEPFTKRAVLFKGYIPHQAYAPLVPGITRISFAFKFSCMSEQLPFVVEYI